MAIASMIMGIASLLCWWSGYGAILGAVLALVAIILAGKCKGTAKEKLAKVGKICGVIGLILNLLGFIVCTVFVGGASCLGVMAESGMLDF